MSFRGGLGCFGVGQSVGLGSGLNDVAAERESVHDRRAQARVVNVFVHPENDSFEAMATEFFSSRSVNTWNNSSAPRRSSSM